MKRQLLFFFLILLTTISAQETPPNIKAIPVNEPIVIDGRLDEALWNKNPGYAHFTQRDPVEGSAPSQKTEVYVAYDSDNLYVAARMHDTSADSIVARLGRRDDFVQSDRFFVFLDPYLDKRSGNYFGVNAAGTYMDAILFNDSWEDDSWDGVWHGKSHIDEDGWYVEMQIPFSQLRFKQSENMVWGINFSRNIARNNERDYTVFQPKDGSGFVSRFIHLEGLKNISESKHMQFLPYVRAKSEHLEVDSNNPFNDGSEQEMAVGADFKIGLTSNITLDATINPDFGQVEADPARINLSDSELFFSERRPFFLEGVSIFNFGYGGANSNSNFNWGNPDYFYSRRIGRSPSGPSVGNLKFADVPDGTTILGAGKISGKIGDNWNVGLLTAVTQREYARVDTGSTGNNRKFDVEVEPSALYNVLRVQKEFNGGKQALGFISTGVIRDFKNRGLEDQFNKSAYTFAVDGWTIFGEDDLWALTGNVGMSHISGNKTRITNVQSNYLHRFQRPDFDARSVDTSATTMQGFSGRVSLNKQKGKWIFHTAFGFIDPDFEINDLGFIWRTNVFNGHVMTGYKWNDPGDYFRRITVLASTFGNWDYDGNNISLGLWTNYRFTTLNYFHFGGGFTFNPQTVSTNLTRGGPKTINKASMHTFGWLETDSRNDFVFGLNWYVGGSQSGYRGYDFGLDFRYKINEHVSVSFAPSIDWSFPKSQYVTTYNDDTSNLYDKRYVFAELKNITFSSGLRLNWIFTPELSLQAYVRPYISAGDYSNYKYLKRANSYDFVKFGEEGSTISKDGNTYTVDADGGSPDNSVEIGERDFRYKFLQGNAVVRWEYMPGSTLYFVWTQDRSSFTQNGRMKWQESLGDLLTEDVPDNIFLVKMSYWFGL